MKHKVQPKKAHVPKIYIPRVMAEMMQATTSNSTSIHFGFGHMCKDHNVLFDLNHIKECNSITGCERIPEFANELKKTPFIEWDLDLKYEAIKAFAMLVVQLQNLTLT